MPSMRSISLLSAAARQPKMPSARRNLSSTAAALLLSASFLLSSLRSGALAFSTGKMPSSSTSSSSPLLLPNEEAPAPTPTRPEDVPAILSRVASRSSQWRQTPLATKIDLLHQILANTWEYGDEWTASAQQSRRISPSRPDHGCARADVMIGSTATMGSYVNGLISVLQHCASNEDHTPPPPTKIRSVAGTNRTIATVWPRTLLDRLEAVGLRGEIVLDDEGAEQMSLEEAYDGGGNDPNRGGGGVAAVLGAGNVDAPIELLCELFLKSRVCVYKPNPVNAMQGRILQKILQPLVEVGCLDFVHGGADVGAALVADPTLEEVVLTGTKSTYDKIRPLVSDTTQITAELGGVNAWIVVPGDKWNRRSVDSHARHIAFARLANNGHVCAAPQVLLVDEEWPWRKEFMDRLRHWMGRYAGAPPFYPGSAGVYAGFRDLPGAEVVPGTDSFADQQRPVILENVAANIGDEEGGISDILSREAFCPVISEVPLARSSGSGPNEDRSPLEFLRTATKFAEDHCFGSLTCNILIPDNIVKKNAKEFDSIVASLPFGIVGVNLFPAFAHSIPQLVWGAPPGHDQSGYGFIGNAGLYKRPQKAVLRAPFNWLGRKCLCVMPPKKTEKVFRRLANYKMRPTSLSQAMLFSALFLNL